MVNMWKVIRTEHANEAGRYLQVLAIGKHLGPVFPLWRFGAGVRSTNRGPRTRPLTNALDHTLSTFPALFSPHPTPMQSLSFPLSPPLPLDTSWGLTKCQSYGFSAIWGVLHVLAAAPSVATSPSSRKLMKVWAQLAGPSHYGFLLDSKKHTQLL